MTCTRPQADRQKVLDPRVPSTHDPKRSSPPYAATLGYVRRSGDGVSELDWAGDGAERLEAFAGAKDRHIAIVEHAPEDGLIDLDALDLVHVHLVGLPPDETFLVDDPPVGDCDLGETRTKPILEQEDDRNEREGVCCVQTNYRQEKRLAETVRDNR